MLSALSKSFFHLLAGSSFLKTIASRYGMRSRGSFARRFIAGETLEEAIAVARELESRGLHLTLDLLGESVLSLEAAEAASRAYLGVIEQAIQAGVSRSLSIKLTQLGLDLDRSATLNHLRRILDVAQPEEFFVRIDMESSPYVDATLDAWETVWRQGYRNVGVVLQSALRRSEADLRRVIALGGRVRLCKGAYDEPPEVAHRSKADVDAAFERMLKVLLKESDRPAVATHDERLIEATKAYATAEGVARDRFEFEMLYGIRRDLQRRLSQSGYGMRIYLPFGREWFPYFMRRLGERPASVVFVVRRLLEERRSPA